MTESVQDDLADKAFATWCVMTQARPALIHALRMWGLGDAALRIERAGSLSALKIVTKETAEQVRQVIWFGPLRRDLSHAASTLQIAATFAGRGDVENASVMAISVLTNTASALSWRRPWTRFGWRARRAEVIAAAQRDQQQRRGVGG